jgi:hypothetical protein
MNQSKTFSELQNYNISRDASPSTYDSGFDELSRIMNPRKVDDCKMLCGVVRSSFRKKQLTESQ